MLTRRDHANYKAISASISDAIRAARVICIFFMTYVHVQLFSLGELETSSQFQIARSIIRDVAGRASVPLLSIISGFLIVGYLSRRSSLQAAKDRATTLLLPLITWNLIALLVFTALNRSQDISINSIFPFTEHGTQQHLTFLRDLFVVSLLSPLLIWGLRRTPIIIVMAIILITAFINTWPVILRAPILMFFTFGLLFGLYRLENLAIYAWSKRFAYVAFGALLIYAAVSDISQLNTYIQFTAWIMPPICVLTFWSAARWIAAQPLSLRLVRILEPAVFLFYLSHYVTAQVFAGIYAQFKFAHTPWIYTLVWITIPVLCFTVATVGRSILAVLPNALSIALSGKSEAQPLASPKQVQPKIPT